MRCVNGLTLGGLEIERLSGVSEPDSMLVCF